MEKRMKRNSIKDPGNHDINAPPAKISEGNSESKINKNNKNS